MSEPVRRTFTTTKTTVRYLAEPWGRTRENPPSLGDLRSFVEACTGIPDDVPVRIHEGQLSESGRRDTQFELTYKHPESEGDGA